MGVVFSDIDGTIWKYPDDWKTLWDKTPTLLPGSFEYLAKHQGMGDTIVLTTSRPESLRAVTEHHLAQLCVPYHMLIMGLSPGPRVLINDQKKGQCRAFAIDLERDKGMEGIEDVCL